MVRYAIRDCEKANIPRIPKWVIPTSTLSIRGAGRYSLPDVAVSGRVYPRLDLHGDAVKPSQCRAPVTTWDEANHVALRYLYVLAHLCTVLLVGLALKGRGRVE